MKPTFMVIYVELPWYRRIWWWIRRKPRAVYVEPGDGPHAITVHWSADGLFRIDEGEH